MTSDLLDTHIWYSNDFPWSQDIKFVYIFDENMPLQKLNWAKETMIFFKISKTTEMHKSFFYVGPNSNDNEIWKYGCYVYCRWWAETWVTRGTWFLYMLLLSVLAHFSNYFPLSWPTWLDYVKIIMTFHMPNWCCINAYTNKFLDFWNPYNSIADLSCIRC